MSVANAYARALYEITPDAKVCDQLESELKALVQVFKQSKEMQTAVLGPITTPKEKERLLDAILSQLKLSPPATRFIHLLLKKERLGLLPQIQEAFSSVRLVSEGGVSGQLISAEPIDQEDLKGLAKAFTKKLGKKVDFRTSTDPTLLAGMKVTVNGVTYDGTLRSQLQQLRDRFVSGSIR